jgi:hypothetical protein
MTKIPTYVGRQFGQVIFELSRPTSRIKFQLVTPTPMCSIKGKTWGKRKKPEEIHGNNQTSYSTETLLRCGVNSLNFCAIFSAFIVAFNTVNLHDLNEYALSA